MRKLSLETVRTTRDINMEAAAAITAKGFGRENNEDNYLDTQAHLEGADYIQLVKNEVRLLAFAAYRRELWRAGN
jgi:hypothetical protein